MGFLTIFIWICAIIFILVVALIVCPIKYYFYGYVGEGYSYSAKINLLFIPIKIDSEKIKAKEKKLRKKAEKEKKKGDGKRNKTGIDWQLIKSIGNKKLVGTGLSLLKNIYLALKPKKLLVSGRIGLPEPHLNGLIYAFRQILPSEHIDIEVAWEEECLAGKMEVIGRLTIIVLVYYLLKFIFSAPARRIICLLIKNVFRRKKKTPIFKEVEYHGSKGK